MPTITIHVPDEIAAYEHDLRYFFETMARKLHVNRHKGTSKDLDVLLLMEMAHEEIREMYSAVIEGNSQFDPPVEAVDAANMMFLAASAIWQMTRQEYDHMTQQAKAGRTKKKPTRATGEEPSPQGDLFVAGGV